MPVWTVVVIGKKEKLVVSNQTVKPYEGCWCWVSYISWNDGSGETSLSQTEPWQILETMTRWRYSSIGLSMYMFRRLLYTVFLLVTLTWHWHVKVAVWLTYTSTQIAPCDYLFVTRLKDTTLIKWFTSINAGFWEKQLKQQSFTNPEF